MSPSNFQAKTKKTCPPPPLKVDKDSHRIKKTFSSPPSSSSSSASSLAVSGPIKPRPVVIYTHSPKIIHTHPKDFMALVQKLTGLSQYSSEDDPSAPRIRKEKGVRVAAKKVKINDQDDESSSAVTDHGNYGSIGDDGRRQCLMQSHHPNYINNIPIFTPKLAEFLCANQPCYNNYTDPLFFSFSNYDFNNFCLGGED